MADVHPGMGQFATPQDFHLALGHLVSLSLSACPGAAVQ